MFFQTHHKKTYNNNFVILLSFVFAFFTFTDFVQAQEYLDSKITSKEQAVFAFFRAANTAPDYNYWITSSSTYKSLRGKYREDYLVKEMLRLGRGYGLYDLDTDVLEIKTPIIVKYYPAKSEDTRPHLKFHFYNLKVTNIPTFDYPFGDDIISLTVKNLNNFFDLTLSPEQSQSVRSKIPYENDEFDASLTIYTRVNKANYQNPVEKIKKGNRWLMVGEIAYLKCEVDSSYAHQTHTLWDYISPWYEEEFHLKNMPEEEKYPHPYDLYK